jgi:hypothetical protein
MVSPQTGEAEPISIPAVPGPANLAQIFWGDWMQPNANGPVGDIEVTSKQLPHNLPSSILDVGVTSMTNDQSLREQGFGVTLAEAASYWKTHRPHGAHVYTNSDLQRLHGG